MAEETNGRKESSKCKKGRKNTLPTKKEGREKKRTVEGEKQEDILLNEDV
jgi:hypothetical protein